MRPREAVVICATPRTGSGLLCSALWSTDLCGHPDEWLDLNTRRRYEELWGVEGDGAYADAVFAFGTTPNGIFGIKVHWHQIESATWLAAGDAPLTELADRVHFCLVTRRDKVRQAVSAYVVKHTGRHNRLRSDDAPPVVDVPFDATAIAHELAWLESGDRRWREYLAAGGITPVQVCYEDDLELGYEQTTRRLLTTFGIEAASDLRVTAEFERQADERSECLVQRYLEAGRQS